MIRLLADAEELPLYELTAQFQMGRTAVSKHLAVLKDAHLVTDRKVGRETRYRLNPAPLREIQDWVSYYERFWTNKMVALAHLLEEEEHMGKDVSLDFEFKSSIEKVWTALTDSNKLAKWIYPNDFKPVVGHKFQFHAEPNQWWDGIINCEVLEVDEPNRLSYTWVSGGENTTVTWHLETVRGWHNPCTSRSNRVRSRASIQGSVVWLAKDGQSARKGIVRLKRTQVTVALKA